MFRYGVLVCLVWLATMVCAQTFSDRMAGKPVPPPYPDAPTRSAGLAPPGLAMEDRRTSGLRGPVTRLREEVATFAARDGAYIESRRQPEIERVFNEAGYLLEERSYGTNGTLLGRGVYTYAAIGKRQQEEYFGPDGRLVTRWTYAYDDKWRMSNMTCFKADDTGTLQPALSYVHVYGEGNRLLATKYYPAYGAGEQKWEYVYNTEAHTTAYGKRNDAGELVLERTLLFDEHDREIGYIDHTVTPAVKVVRTTAGGGAADRGRAVHRGG